MTEVPTASDGGLREPLPDISAWVDYFLAADIPVLRSTAETLEALRQNEDMTDANSIGEMIAGDPLMTLKVLAHASAQRSERTVPAETVTAALVMLGISPFFRDFQAQPTVEQRLAAWSTALEGLQRVLRRAHRGADFALAFTVHRTDPHAAATHAAALLHEFAELLVWVHAPTLALLMQQIQAANPASRSRDVQVEVLGVRLDDLQSALADAWGLPKLLGALPPHERESSAARTVTCAANLARHTAIDWDNPAVPDDIEAVADLLSISSDAARTLVQSIDSK